MPIFFPKLIYNYIQSVVILLKFPSPKIILKTLYFCYNFMCSKLLTLSQQPIAPNYQKLSSYENKSWEKGKLKKKTSWKVSSSLKVFWSFKNWGGKFEVLEFHNALSLYFLSHTSFSWTWQRNIPKLFVTINFQILMKKYQATSFNFWHFETFL